MDTTAMLNLLMAAQQQQEPQGASDNYSGAAMPTALMPQVGAVNQAQTPQAIKNPFDAGITRAIASARESLGMTDKQQQKALRNSMLTFADNMRQQPRESGFFNNLLAAGRSLSPAIRNYYDQESSALNENNQLANQMLKYTADAQAREDMLDEQKWRRKHAENQLGEQKRQHNLMNNFRMQKNNNNNLQLPQELQGFHPLKTNERTVIAETYDNSAKVLHDLDSIKKQFQDFQELSKNDLIDPMNPYLLGKASNNFKDAYGYFSDREDLREETKKRQALQSKLGLFSLELERKIKGGTLTDSMRKYVDNRELLPSLNDAPDVFETKLNNLIYDTESIYNSADASLKYGVHINPVNINKLFPSTKQMPEKEAQPINTANPGQTLEQAPDQELVEMINEKTGKTHRVPINDVSLYESQMGLKRK